MAGFAVETDGADVFGLARATEAERGGGLGPAPPPPRPPENGCSYCGVEVNDSDWELIDAPHDFIITQPISKTDNNGAGSVSDLRCIFVPGYPRKCHELTDEG